MVAEYHDISSVVLGVSWVAVYVLMIRRGLLDKSYGMPILALCPNISWEFIFAFLSDIEPIYRINIGLFFIFDAGVLYTCWRYGKDDFDWPIMKAKFGLILAFCVAISFIAVYAFVRAFDDTYGGLFAAMNTPIYSMLLVAMLLRRNSVKGQSLYIGLAILIGDSAAYLPTLYAQETGMAAIPLLWVHTFLGISIALHVIYIGLYCYVARRDGVGLWKRL